MSHTSEDVFRLEDFVLCIKNFIKKTQEIESEMTELKCGESREIIKWLTENEILQKNIESLQKHLQELNSEKVNLHIEFSEATKKCKTMSALLEEKNVTISKLECEKEEFNVFFEQCKDKLKSCEEQIQKLSVDKDAFKQEVSEKEENIILLKKVINSKNLEIENKKAESLEYERQRDLLKIEIEKNSDKNTEKDKLIAEFKIKLGVLQKETDTLSMSIKNLENDLKNAYIEKQVAEVELKKLAQDNVKLNQDVLIWKEMCNSEKVSNTKLTSAIKTLEANVHETTKDLNNFKSLLSRSEKDILVLKNLQREHEHVLLTKNEDLKHKDHIICQLEERIKELEKNASSFKRELSQLEKSKSSLLVELENKTKQISELESKVENLLNQLTLKEEAHSKIVNSNSSLKIEVENLNKEMTLWKSKSAELKKVLDSEVELCKMLKQEILEKDRQIVSLKISLEEHLTKASEMKIYVSDKSEMEKLKDNELQLNQKITNYKKDIFAARYALEVMENKCSELSRENELLRKNESLKVKDSFQLNKPKVGDIEHALSKTVQFTESLLDLISKILRECSYSSDNEELITNLAALRKQLSQKRVRCGVTPIDFSPDILKSLSMVLKNNLRHTDEELKIVNLISSISNYINGFGEFIESHNKSEKSAATCSPKVCNFLEDTMNTTLNVSCIIGKINDRTIFSHSQIQKELQQAQVQLSEYFSVIQNIICKQAEELKDFKFKLTQMTLPVNSTDYKETQDINLLKRKLKFVKMNSQRWEEETNKMKKFCSDLEKKMLNIEKDFEMKLKSLSEEKKKVEEELLHQIEKLKEANKELDEEANELAEDYKKLRDSRYVDEEEINRLREKLKEYEEERIRYSLEDNKKAF